MIAAGAVVPPNTTVPSGQIFAGNPAKYLRDIKPEEAIALSENLTELRELANVLVEHSEKSHYEFLNDINSSDLNKQMGHEKRRANKLQKYGYWMDSTKKDDFGVEASSAIDEMDEWEQEGLFKYTKTPLNQDNFDLNYEQDMTNYPDAFRKYTENFDRADALRRSFEEEIPGESGDLPSMDIPERPGAMRAWTSKWDPDYNSKFRRVSAQSENRSI